MSSTELKPTRSPLLPQSAVLETLKDIAAFCRGFKRGLKAKEDQKYKEEYQLIEDRILELRGGPRWVPNDPIPFDHSKYGVTPSDG